MRDTLAARATRVREAMAGAGVDAFVVTHLPNVRYLTGFPGTAAIVVVTAGAAYFVTDSRYATVAEMLHAPPDGADASLVQVDDTYDETLAALLRRLDARRVGVEGAHLSISRCSWLARTLGARLALPGVTQAADGPALVPLDDVVERWRAIKDEVELETLRTAAGLLSRVALDQLPRAGAGRAEREIAADLDHAMKGAGFARPAFETIVASGPNSALPHARPTDRILRDGDLVVLDFGGVYDGYCVDLTRTVAIGEPDVASARMHAAVLAAQAAAIAAVRPGVQAGAVDAAAREALAAFGLAERFGHGTGHGLGLEVHEAPRIARRRAAPDGAPDPQDVVLESGMVFTIEPGVYVPGHGGVRIEDDVVVTPDGCEVLTRVPRDLTRRS
jgi:Xaa-Pro aminopeptidase